MNEEPKRMTYGATDNKAAKAYRLGPVGIARTVTHIGQIKITGYTFTISLPFGWGLQTGLMHRE